VISPASTIAGVGDLPKSAAEHAATSAPTWARRSIDAIKSDAAPRHARAFRDATRSPRFVAHRRCRASASSSPGPPARLPG